MAFSAKTSATAAADWHSERAALTRRRASCSGVIFCMIVLVWLVDGNGEYFFNCSGAQAVAGYRAAIAEPVEAGGDYLRSIEVSERDVVLGDLAVLAGEFVGAAAGISQEAPEKNLICPVFSP